jgi:hypothetical protein
MVIGAGKKSKRRMEGSVVRSAPTQSNGYPTGQRLHYGKPLYIHQHTQLAIAARAVMDAWDNPDDSALCNAMVALRKALQQQAGA